jgi:hypothetical protein
LNTFRRAVQADIDHFYRNKSLETLKELGQEIWF